MPNYYNEFDLFAAEWLRELIKSGLIPDGEVDTRSIVDVRPDDLRKFTQCHFFAGIGGWSHALRLAGWPDDRPIWTGSCPCQPFSAAGKGKGKDDERHLWPVFHQLITECRPPVVMGEQVAGKAGYGWFDGVQSDLEREGYASRAVDIPACAVNAPHIRQRLYWVAVVDPRHDKQKERQGNDGLNEQRSAQWGRQLVPAGAGAGGRDFERHPSKGDDRNTFASEDCRNGRWIGDMVNADSAGQREHGGADASASSQHSSDMSDAKSDRHQEWEWQDRQQNARSQRQGGVDIAGNNQSFWHNAEWLTGADGKTRRAKPGVRLLVDGVPNRVGRLRGYGNAIVPPLAAEVIKAFTEAEMGLD